MIDWSRVYELQDEIGEEDFDEIVALFLEEAEKALSVMVRSDAPATAEQMHFLKGSASNLGFTTLAELCKTAEAKAAHTPISAADVAAIVTTFKKSQAVFDAGG